MFNKYKGEKPIFPSVARKPKETSISVSSIEGAGKAINEWMSVVLKFLVASGAFLTFLYCYAFLKFFPTGLTAGDTLFFLWTVSGFTVLHFALMAFSWFATGWTAVLLARWSPTAPRSVVSPTTSYERGNGAAIRRIFAAFDSTIHIIVSVICLLLLVIAAFASPSGAVAIAVTGFMVGSLLHSMNNRSNFDWKTRFFSGALFLLTLMAPFVIEKAIFERELNMVFSGLGIRNSQTSVRLSDENFSLLHAVAQQNHIPIFPCGIEGAERERLVSGVDVLWHGIGERSLIAIPLTTNDNKPSTVTVELRRDGMNVVRSDASNLQRCLEMNDDVLFASGSDALLHDSRAAITEHVQRMLDTNLTLHKVRVIGHADIQPIVAPGKTNYELAKARAERVQEVLAEAFKLEKEKVVPESKGTTEPKVHCSEALPPRMMSECLAPNRRVEIRADFSINADKK